VIGEHGRVLRPLDSHGVLDVESGGERVGAPALDPSAGERGPVRPGTAVHPLALDTSLPRTGHHRRPVPDRSSVAAADRGDERRLSPGPAVTVPAWARR
jgi:hypothetical protein